MKKFFLKIFSLTVISFFIVNFCQASQISFTPMAINVENNKNFIINLNIDSENEKNYTVKIEINFSPEFLELIDFKPANNWIPIKMTGYDATDNQKGIIVKTGGYPGGFKDTVNFGAFTFKPKKDGQTKIEINKNSFILNSDNANTLSKPPTSAAVNIKMAEQKITNLTPESTKSETINDNPELDTDIENIASQTPLKIKISIEPTLNTNNEIIGFKGKSNIPKAILETNIDYSPDIQKFIIDENAQWNWTIPNGLLSGEHHISFRIINPDNQNDFATSVEKINIIKEETNNVKTPLPTNISKPEIPSNQTAPKSIDVQEFAKPDVGKQFQPYWYSVMAIIAIAIFILIFFLINKKNK